MSFKSFREAPLDNFIDRERDLTALWLFVHVPKTAGSSLSNEIAAVRKPYKNIHVDYTLKHLTHEQKLQTAISGFIEQAKAKPHFSASGHLTMPHVRRIQEELPQTKLVSIIRDPVARVISDFRYQRTPMHPPHKDFIERFPTIWDFVEHPTSHNKIARHLAPDFEAPPERMVEEVAEAFTFLGAVEMYPMSFNILFRLFGEEKLPELYVRKTEARAENDVEVTPELRARIRELNPKDLAIYDYVRESLKAKKDEWVASRARAPGVRTAAAG